MVGSSSNGLVRSHDINGSSESDEDVAVVQNPDTYMYDLQEKDHDSQWVRGLLPEDEEVTTCDKSDEPSNTSINAEGTLLHMHFAVGEIIRCPLLLGAASTFNLIIQYVTNMDRSLAIDFPATEEVLWLQGWQVGESFLSFSHRILGPLILSVVLSVSFCAWLSFTIGRSTYDFTALCGVGTALLSVSGLLMQIAMLIRACSGPVHDFGGCEIPFAMYWVCSVARRWCPLMSLWCVTPVLDRETSRRWWRYLMATPVLAFALAVLASIYEGNQASRLFVLAYELQILTWSLFLIHLWNRKCTGGKFEKLKSHTD